VTELLRKYLELEARLSRWRAEHPLFSIEEENLLDELDALWWQFNREELSWLDHYLNARTIQKTPKSV
jgi:molybdopterin-guanine dinucleotide biosynthesis protein A